MKMLSVLPLVSRLLRKSSNRQESFQLVSSCNQSELAPADLHSAFNPEGVRPWEASRWRKIKKLQDAHRNHGEVIMMEDVERQIFVAVKRMPRSWCLSGHAEFIREHSGETEMPWRDLGTVAFLNASHYGYGCTLLGVYRDDVSVYVVTSLATEGDLFTFSEGGIPHRPGPSREAQVFSVARELLEAMRQLHEFGIVHGDCSLENVLLSRSSPIADHRVQLIDFSMATTKRSARGPTGKSSYQAPESHAPDDIDGFLSDTFALGVILYALFAQDYPWLSTKPGGCKCFEFAKKKGFRAYIQKRKIRNSRDLRVCDVLSEPLIDLLEGLLSIEPASRLTLGESVYADRKRRSVWDMAWVCEGPGGKVNCERGINGLRGRACSVRS